WTNVPVRQPKRAQMRNREICKNVFQFRVQDRLMEQESNITLDIWIRNDRFESEMFRRNFLKAVEQNFADLNGIRFYRCLADFTDLRAAYQNFFLLKNRRRKI